MIIELLIKKQQQQLQHCATEYEFHQQKRHVYLWLLKERSKQFLGSVPGLTLSFSAGLLMQFRHHSAIKTVRRLGGLNWLRHLL